MAVPNGGGTSSDNPSSRAPIAFPDFRLFDSAQDILDHNKRIIKEIKVNHEAQTPEALARNCPLIRELNTNIAAVMRAYGSIGDSFSQYLTHQQQQQQQQPQQGGWDGQHGNNGSDGSGAVAIGAAAAAAAADAAAAVPQAPGS